jgi:16S rRNA (guanine527-N7)-methyltransferase
MRGLSGVTIEARGLLERGLADLGLATDSAQVEALLGLAELLARWSQQINLTAHRTPEAIVGRLILDAAALAGQIPTIETLADIGSGAGFPGLPLAILWPAVEVTLIEARLKRHHFQRAAVRELGLANAHPEHGRAEELEPRPHSAAIAQALAAPDRAVPWMLPWVREGGYILLPRGATPGEIPAHPALRNEELRHYCVPCGGPERTLWIGRRLPS